MIRASLDLFLDEGLRSEALDLPLKQCLTRVRAALRSDDLEDALRQADRGYRSLGNHGAPIAALYGRLLSLEARDYDAALRMLQRATEFGPDPDVAALTAFALCQLRRPDDARQQLERALSEYCVEPGGLLSEIAGKLLQHDLGAAGWIGHAPDLELVGELSAEAPSNALEISVDGRAAFTQLLAKARGDGRRPFKIRYPDGRFPRTVEARSRGQALLGSGLPLAQDFNLDGRTRSTGRRVMGWVRLGWLPRRRLRLRFEDENGGRAQVMAGRTALLGSRWPFALPLRSVGLKGARIEVSAQLPDGRWQPVPDSPLLLESAIHHGGVLPHRLGSWCDPTSAGPKPKRASRQGQRTLDVIIPVYRGREESLACIDSVLATIEGSVRVLVVDDATDDAELAAALDALARKGRIELLRNVTNLGFVGSVNRALAQHPSHDVILLNSDTLVFGDWLRRLRAAAYSELKVGTVTPWSNNGTIASYPNPASGDIEREEAAAMHALAAATHAGIRAGIPVGVGFCLYIRRDCLKEVGPLDEAVFGKGYGEETDFCLRASRRGWSHRLAADVFVYHAGARSFGTRRAALLDRARRLTNLRHPGYDRFIAGFVAQDPLQPWRRRLDEQRLLALSHRYVLLVTLSLRGGVDRFVNERCRQLRAQGLVPIVLRPAAIADARRCELWTDALELPNLQYAIPGSLAELSTLLGALRLEFAEIQHFLHIDPRVIELLRSLQVPYDVYVHDYSWICPRVTLIGDSGRYCGEPPVSVCRACVRRNGSNLGEAISAPALRARSEVWLRGARRVVAPSADAAARMRHHFDGLELEVKAHSEPTLSAYLPSWLEPRPIKRIAVIGAIGDHKGYRVLHECARDARDRNLPLEFVVIGYTQDDAPLLKTGKVFITGRYSEGEAPHLLRRERPDVAWLPSVTPETWCYALDCVLEAGLPVMAFDLGAIAERLRAADRGLLLPLTASARRINESLIDLAADLKIFEGSGRTFCPNATNTVAG